MASDECSYYYYDSGYCCALKREKEGRSSIDSDTVHKYCWGYHYSDCPLYKDRSSSTGCFLTSACTEAKGLPDDCHELTVLRQYRDTYLAGLNCGKCEIDRYYYVAPQIVAKIKEMPDAKAIFDKIYEELVAPCVKLIEGSEMEAAHALYREYVIRLEEQYIAPDFLQP